DRLERSLDTCCDERLEVSKVNGHLRERLHGAGGIPLGRDEVLWVVGDVIREQEGDLILRVFQRLHPFLDVRDDPLERLEVPVGGDEGLEPSEQLVDRQAPDPYTVEEIEALLVPLTGGALHLLDLPEAGGGVHRKDLFFGARCPADERDVNAPRLRQVTGLLELRDRGSAMSLRQ